MAEEVTAGERIAVHPATAERWGDVEGLFGPRGAYAGCWCMFWRVEILGHSQISLTMNTYGHIHPETQRDATSKVAGMFGKRGPRSEPPPAVPGPTEPADAKEGQPAQHHPASPEESDGNAPPEAPASDQGDRPNPEG